MIAAWLTCVSWSLGMAWAGGPGDLVPKFEVGTSRQVKVDLFRFAPEIHPWGTDWKTTLLEQTTGVATCTVVAPRVEDCRFEDGVWWGLVAQDSTTFQAVLLPRSPTMEYVWGPRGNLVSIDIRNDGGSFRSDAAQAIFKATHRRGDALALSAQSADTVGRDVERDFARDLGAALEWELPKGGDDHGAAWSMGVPQGARHWLGSTAAGTVDAKVTGRDDAGVHLTMGGEIGEKTADGATRYAEVQTQIKGEALFDRTVGRVTHSWMETLSRSAQGVVGHARMLQLLTAWKPGDPTTPADLPPTVFP